MRVEVIRSRFSSWGNPSMHVRALRQWSDELTRQWTDLGRPTLVLQDPQGDLNFLTDLPGLRVLGIIGVVGSRSDAAVGDCQDLESLTLITDCTNQLDLTDLSSLKVLHVVGERKGIDQLPQSLETLELRGLRWRDLGPLAGLARLRQLDFAGRRLSDVSALGRCPALSQIQLIYAQFGQPFVQLREARLERVRLETCSRVESLDGIEAQAESLEYLSLADLPRLQSIRPIGGLKKLKVLTLSGRTNVVDGDLSPIVGFPGICVAGVNRQHYRPQLNELDTALWPDEGIPVFL